MNTLTKDLFGNTYEIRQCTVDDIPKHFEKVADAVPTEDHDAYKYRMSECIEAGTAFTLTDDSCFIYYLNYNNIAAVGSVLYGKNAPMKLIALLSGVFRILDKITFKLDFHLHPGSFVQDYKSLITETSLKRQNNREYPLVVRIDHLKAKIDKIHKRRGIKWEMS